MQFSVKVEISGIQEGDNVTMKCIVPSTESILVYRWFFESLLLPASNNANNTLELRNVSRNNSGEYVCQVNTTGGVFSGKEVLNVQCEENLYSNFVLF